MAHKIVVLPGDGIGPEIAEVAQRVLQSAGQESSEEFVFEEKLIGGAAMWVCQLEEGLLSILSPFLYHEWMPLWDEGTQSLVLLSLTHSDLLFRSTAHPT